MKLYVTRHGRTEYNDKRRISGSRADIELTEKGREQARALGRQMKADGIAIDLVLTSALARAKETGALIAAELGAPTAEDARLNERDFGALEGASYDDPAFAHNNYQFCLRLGGGESVLRLAQRLYNLLDELPQKYPGKTLLLVSHGAAARVIYTYFCEVDNAGYAEVRTRNCELREYDYDGVTV